MTNQTSTFHVVNQKFSNYDEKLDRNTVNSFSNTYLSFNCSLEQSSLNELSLFVQKEMKLLSKHDIRVWKYPKEQLHFSLVGLLVKDNDISDYSIKSLVGEKEPKIIKIVEEEVNGLKAFEIQPRFVKSTVDSVFLYCSLPKNPIIAKLQINLVKRIGELFTSNQICSYGKKNKEELVLINFLRWQVKTRNEVKDIVEQFAKPKEVEFESHKALVTEAALTYSDQFWTDPSKNSIAKFKFGN